MKKAIKPILTVLLLTAFIAGGIITAYMSLKNRITAGNREVVSSRELFSVSGDDVAIIYNRQSYPETGLYKNGKVYLDMTGLCSDINDTFYYDEENNRIIYATVQGLEFYAEPEFIKNAGEIYLDLELLKSKSDIIVQICENEGVHWVTIEDEYVEEYESVLNGKANLRAGDSKESKIIRQLSEGEEVTAYEDYSALIEEVKSMKSAYTRIKTKDGYFGYVRMDELNLIDSGVPYSGYIESEKPSLKYSERLIIGWHQIFGKGGNDKLKEVVSEDCSINIIIPTWFSLQGDYGEYTSFASKAYVEKAHNMGLDLWAMIDNFTNESDTNAVLKSFELRQKLIGNLISDAKETGITGINIDFEDIDMETAEHFREFIREFHIESIKEGIVLSACLPNPAAYNEYLNMEELSEWLDYVIIMGYDEHYVGSDPGPVASYEFTYNGIQAALEEVSSEKIIEGVPLYTRIWTVTGDTVESRAVGFNAARKWFEDSRVTEIWDEKTGMYYGSFSEGSRMECCWQEDESLLSQRYAAIKNAGLAGVAVWKLGLDNENVWKVLN